MKKTIILFLLVFMMTGCFLTGGDKVERKFPAEVKSELYGALNDAENVIKSKGVHKIQPKNVKVELIPGEKKIGGMWCFKSPELNNMWVLGVTLMNGRIIKLAHEPGNRRGINIAVAIHEFAHHWLFSNGHRDGHYPLYDKNFINWAYSRKMQGRSLIEHDDNIEILSVEYLEASEVGLLSLEENYQPVSITALKNGEIITYCGVIEIE
jgi:hypothetical protein